MQIMCSEYFWDLLPLAVSSSNLWKHVELISKSLLNKPSYQCIIVLEGWVRNESKAMVYMCGVISTIIWLILTTINDNNILNVLPVDGQNPKVSISLGSLLRKMDQGNYEYSKGVIIRDTISFLLFLTSASANA